MSFIFKSFEEDVSIIVERVIGYTNPTVQRVDFGSTRFGISTKTDLIGEVQESQIITVGSEPGTLPERGDDPVPDVTTTLVFEVFDDLTEDRTLTIKVGNANRTLEVGADGPVSTKYVPYNGAASTVDLGAEDFITTGDITGNKVLTKGGVDSSTTSPADLLILCGADKTLVLSTVVYEDLRIVTGSFDRPGVSDPTYQDWQPGGAGTTFKVLKFNKNQWGTFICQLPHTYKEGTNISVHVHWTPGDRGVSEDTHVVAWKLDYSWTNIDGVFGESATANLNDTCTGVNDAHLMTPEVTLTGTDKTISSILMCKIYRDDVVEDTWVGTGADGPALLEVDFHFQVDTLGSRQITTK